MNCALYGFGPPKRRKWLMVDLGVSFAGEDHSPGVDLIVPDIKFIEKAKKDLVGIIITPRPRGPYRRARRSMAASRRQGLRHALCGGLAGGAASERAGRAKNSGRDRRAGRAAHNRSVLAVEFIPVAHSIPESCALAIRTEAGLIVHTGDWKIDATPLVGRPTDEARLKALGDEGVLALICRIRPMSCARGKARPRPMSPRAFPNWWA